MKPGDLEIWIKDGVEMVVRTDPNTEYRFEVRDGATWISGMCLFTLIRDGWVKKNEVQEETDSD